MDLLCVCIGLRNLQTVTGTVSFSGLTEMVNLRLTNLTSVTCEFCVCSCRPLRCFCAVCSPSAH